MKVREREREDYNSNFLMENLFVKSINSFTRIKRSNIFINRCKYVFLKSTFHSILMDLFLHSVIFKYFVILYMRRKLAIKLLDRNISLAYIVNTSFVKFISRKNPKTIRIFTVNTL